MSRTKTARPQPPTLSQADALAPRYRAGASLADLAREFGCWRNDLRRMFAALGCLRGGDRLPRLCRVCQSPVRSASRRDLCADHVRRFCSRCESRLPRGRKNRWCSRCEQERKPEDYRYRRLLALRSPPLCRDCRQEQPAGRIDARCPDCAAAWRRERRASQRKRRCAACREFILPRNLSYCDSCSAALGQWRRDYRRGDPAALAVRPLKEYRRWQKTPMAIPSSTSTSATGVGSGR